MYVLDQLNQSWPPGKASSSLFWYLSYHAMSAAGFRRNVGELYVSHKATRDKSEDHLIAACQVHEVFRKNYTCRGIYSEEMTE